MKYSVLVLFLLVTGAVLIAGCTQSSAPAATPASPTGAAPQATVTAEPKVTFSLGQEYLHKKYSFNSDKDVFTEQFRVSNDPWAIDITVNPMSTDAQLTWFEITATNIDNGHSQTFGYGRTNALDKHQQFPMYNEGPYKFEMKGNLVSVDVNIAKRNP
jgi:hypothetical protein